MEKIYKPYLARYKDPEARKLYNREYSKKYMREYTKKLKAEGKSYNYSEYLKSLRLRAMNKIGGTICANCGCNTFIALEINHINGGGNLELKSINYKQYLRNIINEKVDISQYNVLCRVCNAQHYLESILGIKGHKIKWNESVA